MLTMFLKVRVTEYQHSLLASIARERGISISDLVREVLSEYAERQLTGKGKKG